MQFLDILNGVFKAKATGCKAAFCQPFSVTNLRSSVFWVVVAETVPPHTFLQFHLHIVLSCVGD